MAPLLLVAADVAENVSTLLAMGMQGLGVETLALFLLIALGICSTLKVIGLVACTPFLIVRIVIVGFGKNRVGAVK